MKKLILLSALVAAATTTDAKVTLPKIFSDNMVMQQNAKANLWGDANANSTVKITTSWNKKTITAKADGNGKQHGVAGRTAGNAGTGTDHRVPAGRGN